MNLDPNALKVKKEGWSSEDRARELLDIWNEYAKETKPWDYKDFVNPIFPTIGTHDFIEGFLTAALFFGEAISEGFVRDNLRIRDGNTRTINPLMLQRFLTWVEKTRPSEEAQ